MLMNLRMQKHSVESVGSPATESAKTYQCGAAKEVSIVYREKGNLTGDLLARTIAARPPNEDRIRGMAA